MLRDHENAGKNASPRKHPSTRTARRGGRQALRAMSYARGKEALSPPRRSTADRDAAARQGLREAAEPVPYLARMEQGFDSDLSHVKAHTGDSARAACDAMGAQAYAMGDHVAFRGPRPPFALVAHEVAHVRQKSLGRTNGGARAKSVEPSTEDAIERQADAAAAIVAGGGTVGAAMLSGDAHGAVRGWFGEDIWGWFAGEEETRQPPADYGAYCDPDTMCCEGEEEAASAPETEAAGEASPFSVGTEVAGEKDGTSGGKRKVGCGASVTGDGLGAECGISFSAPAIPPVPLASGVWLVVTPPTATVKAGGQITEGGGKVSAEASFTLGIEVQIGIPNVACLYGGATGGVKGSTMLERKDGQWSWDGLNGELFAALVVGAKVGIPPIEKKLEWTVAGGTLGSISWKPGQGVKFTPSATLMALGGQIVSDVDRIRMEAGGSGSGPVPRTCGNDGAGGAPSTNCGQGGAPIGG